MTNFKAPQVVFFEAPPGYENAYPWTNGTSLLFIGEITNMPGHCIVVDRKGKVYWGYHTDVFREPAEEEL